MVLYILLCYISPKSLNVEKSIKIDAPASVSYNLVNDLKNWELWSPWNELDTNVIYDYSDKTYGVGARVNWDGNAKVGKGSQTIVATEKNDSIKISLSFEGTDDPAFSSWQFDPVGDQTEVTWNFKSPDAPYFLRIFNLIMKGSLKKNLADGLGSLKSLSEQRAKDKIYRGMKIEEKLLEERHYIMRRKEISFENMQQFYAQNLGGLFALVQSHGLTMQGMPSGLYFKWDEANQMTDMAAAIPITEDADFNDVDAITLPQSRAVVLDYYGDYSGLDQAHMAIDDYMKDYELLHNYPVVEEYLTDPGQESDPSKWLTRIMYFIQ